MFSIKKYYAIFFLSSFVLIFFILVFLAFQIWAPHIHGALDNLILTLAFVTLLMSWVVSYYFFYSHEKAEMASAQSEATFKEAFENAPMGITLTALNGKFLKVNPHLCHTLGYTQEELLQKTFADVTYPDDVAASKQGMRDLLEKKIILFEQEKRYIHKSGAVIWVLLRASVVADTNGKALYFLAQIMDITERKQTQDALKRSEHMYSVLVQQAGEGIVIFQDGKFRYINDYFLRMFGYERSEMIEHSFLDFVALEDKKEATERYQARYGGGTRYPQFYEFTPFPLLKKDGGKLFIEGTMSLIEFDNKPASLILMHDVTKQQEVNRMKSEFVSIASHQMRTPLTGIKWFAELLLQGRAGKLSKTQHTYVDKVYQSNERMLELIDNLLDVSHIEEQKAYELPAVTISLKTIIQRAVDMLRPVAKKKNIKLVVQYDGAGDMMVCADEDKMVNALENVVNNAVKYSNEGSSVDIGCSRANGDGVCFVKDRGPGIPLEQQHRVFDKFFRADNVLAQTGTGLGLYIAKSLVDNHGGRIWFTSKENEGATFYVALPLVEK